MTFTGINHGACYDPRRQRIYPEGGNNPETRSGRDDFYLCALFRQSDVAGVCIWVIDDVKEPPETFSLIRKHLLE